MYFDSSVYITSTYSIGEYPKRFAAQWRFKSFWALFDGCEHLWNPDSSLTYQVHCLQSSLYSKTRFWIWCMALLIAHRFFDRIIECNHISVLFWIMHSIFAWMLTETNHGWCERKVCNTSLIIDAMPAVLFLFVENGQRVFSTDSNVSASIAASVMFERSSDSMLIQWFMSALTEIPEEKRASEPVSVGFGFEMVVASGYIRSHQFWLKRSNISAGHWHVSSFR